MQFIACIDKLIKVKSFDRPVLIDVDITEITFNAEDNLYLMFSSQSKCAHSISSNGKKTLTITKVSETGLFIKFYMQNKMQRNV